MTSSGFDRNYIRFQEGEEIVNCTDEDAYDELSVRSGHHKRIETSSYDSRDSSVIKPVIGITSSVISKEDSKDTVSVLSKDNTEKTMQQNDIEQTDVEQSDGYRDKKYNKFNHQLKPKSYIPASSPKLKTKNGHLDLTVIQESILDENGESIFSYRPIISQTIADLNIIAESVFPVMKINNAVYGHLTDQKKQIDVTSNIETLVEKQVLLLLLFF